MPTTATAPADAPYRVVDTITGHTLCHCADEREAEGRAYIHSLLRSRSRVFAVQERRGGAWVTVSQTK